MIFSESAFYEIRTHSEGWAQRMCALLRGVLVGAYDGEGFVVLYLPPALTTERPSFGSR
jgi:hypothetical protein